MSDRPQNRGARVGEVLRDVLQRVDPEQQMRVYRLWTFWDHEVGEAIARRAQPSGFRNGILFVTVATQSWMQELQFMKDTMRERLNARLGAALIRDIYFVSGTIEPPPAEPAAAERAPSGSALIEVPRIEDPELAAAFARIVDARARRLAARRPPGK